MKKSLVVTLILLFVLHSSAFALGFNENKLLELKPLLSERMRQRARDYETNKIWPTLIFSAIGAGIILTNASEKVVDNYRLDNMMAGAAILSIGITSFFLPGIYQSDVTVLDEQTQPGLEREKYSYFMLKKYALQAKTGRESARYFMGLGGLLVALVPLLAPDATPAAKSAVTITGLTLSALGFGISFMPTEMELEAERVDLELME